jgi:cytochrome c2
MSRLFLALSLGLLATVVWAFWAEYRAEWRVMRGRFQQLEATVRPESGGPGDDLGNGGLTQIWLPDLGRVDRCSTCHRGISDPAFASVALPFRTHPGTWLTTHRPDRFGCTVCHGGLGEATTYRGAAHRPTAPGAEPMFAGELMESNCGACHRERRPRQAPWLADGRVRMADSNCVACHDIPGFGPDDVRAPRLESVGLKVGAAFFDTWLADPKRYLERSRMPNFRLTPDEAKPLAAFLRSLRATPLLVAPAGVTGRGAATRGGLLFRTSRCVTCHEVDGRGGTTGPALTHVASKVRREALWSWLKDPHREQPTTLMPHFHLTDAEIDDLVQYMVEELRDRELGLAVAEAAPPEVSAVAAGREVYIRRGCYACHPLEALGTLAKIGPKQAGLGDRIVDMAFLATQGIAPSRPNWLFTKLRAPETMARAAKMPTFGFTPPEAGAITVALLSLRERELPAGRLTTDPAVPRYDPQGPFGALVRRYRCLSCHTVGGIGGRIATVALDRIGSQLRREHIATFLKAPFAVRVGLVERMPRFNPTDDEVRTLVEHLTTVFVDDALAVPLASDAGAAERGRASFEALGCRACHAVGGRGGYVGPDLSGAGLRMTAGWTKAWLLAPQRWKPGTLEPERGLTEAQAVDLAAYLMTQRKSPTTTAGAVR